MESPLSRERRVVVDETPVLVDRLVGEQQAAALAAPDHQFDAADKQAARNRGVPEFSRALEIVLGDLHGGFDQ
jgi:hypothetical protein